MMNDRYEHPDHLGDSFHQTLSQFLAQSQQQMDEIWYSENLSYSQHVNPEYKALEHMPTTVSFVCMSQNLKETFV